MTLPVYLGRRERLGDLTLLASGKVRDVYELDADRLVFVTSDRVSAFDVQMRQGIPRKGAVLTAVALHWFDQTRDILPNHLLSTDLDEVPGLTVEERRELAGRVMIVRRCEPTPVEWVVRGYLCGMGWKEYDAQGTVSGRPLPAGLAFCARLDRALLTPSTKDAVHDRPISLEETKELVGPDCFDEAHEAALALYERGRQALSQHGILLADTKFEFGHADGRLYLIDEALTPDSSRFWPEERYEPGRIQPSYDKQILRDWLETLDWDKEPPAPDLPASLIETISDKYVEIAERITGRPLAAAVATS